jgi:hypothetical protein
MSLKTDIESCKIVNQQHGVVPIVSSEIVRPIAVEIVKALKNPRVLRWTTWDVFAGRQINHERGLSEEESVIEVLKRHWPNNVLGQTTHDSIPPNNAT